MKKRRELKVGDKVRFEHQYLNGTEVGVIEEVSIDGISLATSKGICIITRRQVISVFVKKKKAEPEELKCDDCGSEGGEKTICPYQLEINNRVQYCTLCNYCYRFRVCEV